MKQFKQFFLVLLALVMLLSFALAEQDDTVPATEGQEEEDLLILNDGDPWIDYSLRENIVLAEEKPDSPKDDFYLWINYDWLRSAEIAPGYYDASSFADVEQEISAMCLEMLNDSALTGEDAALVRSLYNACLDWDARNALGAAPLKTVIEQIAAVSTLDELTAVTGRKDYIGKQLFDYDIGADPNDPDTWITCITPMSLLLMDSAEYRERTRQGDLCETAYQTYLTKMLEKLGYAPEEASDMLVRVLALEAELADSIMTSAEAMAPEAVQRTNNVMTREEAEKFCSHFPWTEILDRVGYAGVQRYQIEQPAYLQKMDQLYREDRLEDLKDILIVKTTLKLMDLLDRESYDLYTELSNCISGMEGVKTDEENACDKVRFLLPAQIGHAFREKYDDTKMQADILRICEEAIDCYRRMLAGEEWLTEETRTKAIEKLDAMKIIAVFPEKQPDNRGGLNFEGLGYFDCVTEVRRYYSDLDESLADQPIDHDFFYATGEDFWANDLLTTNAMYDPTSNTIIIMRGILGGAFYREDMSEEALYGAIGAIIGHEISHAFDPTCSQFDAHGRLNNWWTEADNAAFSARAQKLIDYYDSITVFNGTHMSGESVQGEAVADITGIQCMLTLLEQKKENVDYRAFFEAFARAFRSVITMEAEYFQLLQDSHPVSNVRVNTVVQQFPQFYEAYGITEGDGMYLAPEDRVHVW